jgi:transcriptional regulator with XRE-family HTH domain
MPPRNRIDVPALYSALDWTRQDRGLSWRQLAGELGCSPSTMTRLGNGLRPDVDTFVTFTRWLGRPAEHFTLGDGEDPADRTEPELRTRMRALLRARTDLGEEELAHLEEALLAAVRRDVERRAEENP